MTKRGLRISHVVVQVIAVITLAELGMATFWPTYSYNTANSWLGMPLIIWGLAVSLALPVYVGCEAWWTRKLEVRSNRLWIDAVLAATCFALFWGGILYAFTHYSMI